MINNIRRKFFFNLYVLILFQLCTKTNLAFKFLYICVYTYLRTNVRFKNIRVVLVKPKKIIK